MAEGRTAGRGRERAALQTPDSVLVYFQEQSHVSGLSSGLNKAGYVRSVLSWWDSDEHALVLSIFTQSSKSNLNMQNSFSRKFLKRVDSYGALFIKTEVWSEKVTRLLQGLSLPPHSSRCHPALGTPRPWLQPHQVPLPRAVTSHSHAHPTGSNFTVCERVLFPASHRYIHFLNDKFLGLILKPQDYSSFMQS